MQFKLKLPKSAFLARFIATRTRRVALGIFVFLSVSTLGTISYFYHQYDSMIEEKLEAGPFADTSLLYAAPHQVRVGDSIQAVEIAAYLRRAGYSEDSNRSRVGWYRIRADAVEVNPGPDAFDPEGAVLKIEEGKLTDITSLQDHAKRNRYMLEPEPIGNVFDKQRQKRRIVRFDEIPRVLVNALISAEDKNFFHHPGFDPFGIMRAVYRDVFENRKEGASTLTQQLARTLFLGADAGLKRKLPETLITVHLEQKLTKEQIFEYYANSIDMGHQGSFWVRGFGQSAQVYFGKDISQLTLPESALLAGMPKGPALYDPFRHPDKALVRRNLVLKAMLENKYITQQEFDDASAVPIQV
ncbi:MAG: transglycosylase domain-containing protein, partial [Acidobacteriota bacterium]